MVVLGACLELLLIAIGLAEPTRDSLHLWDFLLSVVWSWWVCVNRRYLKQGFAFGFDALVFFAWPVLVPYYLIKSRAVRNWPTARPVWMLYALPFVIVLGWVAVSIV
ncbi:hypothetical protein [Chitinimonas naiadis]